MDSDPDQQEEPIEQRRDRLTALLHAQLAHRTVRERLWAKHGLAGVPQFYDEQDRWYQRISQLEAEIERLCHLADAELVDLRIRWWWRAWKTIGDEPAEALERARDAAYEWYESALGLPAYIRRHLLTNFDQLDVARERRELAAYQWAILDALNRAQSVEAIEAVRPWLDTLYREVEYRWDHAKQRRGPSRYDYELSGKNLFSY